MARIQGLRQGWRAPAEPMRATTALVVPLVIGISRFAASCR
jgi:hypothetical protein